MWDRGALSSLLRSFSVSGDFFLILLFLGRKFFHWGASTKWVVVAKPWQNCDHFVTTSKNGEKLNLLESRTACLRVYCKVYYRIANSFIR
ncbi:predicted protein [Arabidopsis lyrata subsp. lyrata]|uniref:Predicted protein n=1 Tax=Arabidopsis lyrata subsp. lyrata TaxID=81972 RepID=D7KM06_ARALL|nr:predicted protein [Arabidopsis lyrata subsp. lyrata]